MVLLDTHVLLWWAVDPDKLSSAAAASLQAIEHRGAFASAISIWELGVKVQRGKLEIGISIQEFTRRIQKSGIIELLPVNTATWLRSLELDWDHRDPADRVIVATAILQDVPLITADTEIRRFGGVSCVW
ncbi:MAG: type II toxin-antitoxin system VapC family toxin [Deltaproteobacteria bacterium]|nr:MAG: type II toxin-antitoxin system VapC family toxin [Deltaproteobacteria bacterium]TMQ17234.1 MAG: type II toxin-antitoxin system VapC family toxin [Deltaproteobacteria bacterium]